MIMQSTTRPTAGDPPIRVKIGKPFTIATTTTVSPDLAFCEVVGSTQAPILPLSGSVSASATGIIRTVKCTVGKDNVRVSCEFNIKLVGKSNGPPIPARGFDSGDGPTAAALSATAENPPKDLILIK